MGLVINPLVIPSAIPKAKICVTAVYRTGCGALNCVSTPKICIPQHDDKRLVVSVIGSDGVAFDVTGAAQISFAVATSNTATSKLLTKTLTAGGVRFINSSTVDMIFTSTETGTTIGAGLRYYEMSVTNLAGDRATIMAGQLEIQNTIIGD